MATPDGVRFSIALKGDTTGTLWTGDFRAKDRLSWKDRITIDKVRRELLGPNPAGADVLTINVTKMLSELAVRLTEAPPWWYGNNPIVGGLDLADENLLLKIYDEAINAEIEALKKVQEAGQAAQAQLQGLREKEDTQLRDAGVSVPK